VAPPSPALLVTKSNCTRQVPKAGAVPGQLWPGCLLTLPSPHLSLCPPFLSCSHSYKLPAGQRSRGCSRHGDPAASCAALGPSQVPAGSGTPVNPVGPGQLPLASSGHAFLPHTAAFRHCPPPGDTQLVPLRQRRRQLPGRQAPPAGRRDAHQGLAAASASQR